MHAAARLSPIKTRTGCRMRLAEHLCVRVRALACARVCLRLYVLEHACVCSTATRAAGEVTAAVTHLRTCECFGDPAESRSVQLHAEYPMFVVGYAVPCSALMWMKRRSGALQLRGGE